MTDFLLVDDDSVFRERVARALVRRGLDVVEAANAAEALAAAERRSPQRALVDLRMPGESGIDLIPRLLAVSPQMKIVVLTGYGSIATTQRAMKNGAHGYITKPCDVDRMLEAFEENSEAPAPEIPAPSLAQVEWEHIQRILGDHDGNISRAAKALGMNRRSLQRKLSKAPKLQ